jgi:hypothetical protein
MCLVKKTVMSVFWVYNRSARTAYIVKIAVWMSRRG